MTGDERFGSRPACKSVPLPSPIVKPSRGDFVAGISVAFILVPQSLAYAEIAGLPAYFGLYAATAAPIAASFFASSRYLQTGPVAMTSLLTFGALTAISTPGTTEYIEQALLLALIVGVVRIGLGLLRGGAVAYLMSQPMLIGFTSAAAILIIASQLPTALGATSSEDKLLLRALDAATSPSDWHWVGIGLAVLTVLLVLGGRRVHKVFPGVLLAVIIGLVLSAVTEFTGLIIGEIPAGFPPLGFDFPWSTTADLIIPGVVIALVGFAEPAAIARTLAAQDRERWDPNREMISQGVANVASALTSGFPVGGSFSRSSINKLAGGESRWSGGIAGLTALVFVPFAFVLDDLPRAVLAAAVIAGVARLVRIPTMLRLTRMTWGQSVVAWGTFLATLALSPRIDLGVIVGVVLATAVHLRREMRVRVDASYSDGTLELRPSGVLYFASAPRLLETLIDQLAAYPDTSEVIVNLERLGRIDYTGAQGLKGFTDDVEAAGLHVSVRAVPAHARGTLTRSWGDALVRVRWD